jgi:hypothetical protein
VDASPDDPSSEPRQSLLAPHFSVGIVDPPQDMNAANPSTELLVTGPRFYRPQFDLKHVHRTILNSRLSAFAPAQPPTGTTGGISHALVKRMPAEVALDAIAQTTGTKLVFNNYAAPPDTRAIGMALSFRAGRPEYFMETFGRPPRREICSCERSGISLAQRYLTTTKSTPALPTHGTGETMEPLAATAS